MSDVAVLEYSLGRAPAPKPEVLVRNPIDHVSRLHKPKRTPTALTATEVNAIRAVIRAWELTRGDSGPNPDGQLDDAGDSADLRHRDL